MIKATKVMSCDGPECKLSENMSDRGDKKPVEWFKINRRGMKEVAHLCSAKCLKKWAAKQK